MYFKLEYNKIPIILKSSKRHERKFNTEAQRTQSITEFYLFNNESPLCNFVFLRTSVLNE